MSLLNIGSLVPNGCWLKKLSTIFHCSEALEAIKKLTTRIAARIRLSSILPEIGNPPISAVGRCPPAGVNRWAKKRLTARRTIKQNHTDAASPNFPTIMVQNTEAKAILLNHSQLG